MMFLSCFRRLQDRHRPVIEFAYDGADDLPRRISRRAPAPAMAAFARNDDGCGRRHVCTARLAFTGKGHGTDRAVLLGLLGLGRRTTARSTGSMRSSPVSIRGKTLVLRLDGHPPLAFGRRVDMIYD
jgi:hypothetical protein